MFYSDGPTAKSSILRATHSYFTLQQAPATLLFAHFFFVSFFLQEWIIKIKALCYTMGWNDQPSFFYSELT